MLLSGEEEEDHYGQTAVMAEVSADTPHLGGNIQTYNIQQRQTGIHGTIVP